MNLVEHILTSSDCYKAGRKITPKGIMVHSTATPGVMHERWFTVWSQPGWTVCPHAVVDDTGVYQLLPWDHRAWHAGASANDTHISFEICEPAGVKYNSGGWAIVEYDVEKNSDYFWTMWNQAVDLCTYLCLKYGLSEKDIVCHSEGYKLGIASNHSDVMQWFPKHGKTMDDFRGAVKVELDKAHAAETEPNEPEEKPEPSEPKSLYRVQVGAYSKKENAEAMLEKLQSAGYEGIIKQDADSGASDETVAALEQEIMEAQQQAEELQQETMELKNQVKAAADILNGILE